MCEHGLGHWVGFSDELWAVVSTWIFVLTEKDSYVWNSHCFGYYVAINAWIDSFWLLAHWIFVWMLAAGAVYSADKGEYTQQTRGSLPSRQGGVYPVDWGGGGAQNLSIKKGSRPFSDWGAGIAQWLEHRTRDWKVAGSNPCWNGGRIFFSRVDFLCWLLFRYPFHPRVTTVARKKSRSFCQKCRWQVTAKHAYTLRMWILLNCASALVTTCP